MPLTPPGITGAVLGGLASAALIGTANAQLAAGVGAGVMLWIGQLTVVTADVGTAGVGAGTLPCAIPQPSLLGGMMAGMAATGTIGVAAPLLATGLANGLALAFLQGLITTVHPVVGVGAATATFPGPSAVPSMIAGFKAAGMVGTMTEKTATAVGIGLDIAFGSFVVPIPIVGPPSPVSVSGAGSGKIL